MYCSRYKKNVVVWWIVCNIYGYDIKHLQNNELKKEGKK